MQVLVAYASSTPWYLARAHRRRWRGEGQPEAAEEESEPAGEGDILGRTSGG